MAAPSGGVKLLAMSRICPVHPEYDGIGDPPEPDCEDCQDLHQEVEG